MNVFSADRDNFVSLFGNWTWILFRIVRDMIVITVPEIQDFDVVLYLEVNVYGNKYTSCFQLLENLEIEIAKTN